jgi:SAM-dependent methyltransferase
MRFPEADRPDILTSTAVTTSKARFPIEKASLTDNPVISFKGQKSIFGQPFGYEYAGLPRWNCFERFYIRLFGLVDLPSRLRARLIIKALRSIKWNTMIDFGSGTGAYSCYFSRSPEVHVWGVDTDPARISECNELNNKLQRKSLRFIRGSTILENDIFKPNSIDVVLAVEVLRYLPDIHAGINEILRVLKAGGHLIVHLPVLGCKGTYDRVLYDTGTLARILKQAGLEPVSVTQTHGKTEDLLCRIFAYCTRSRFLIAATFPLLLLFSLLCGKENRNGSYCMIIARKQDC